MEYRIAIASQLSPMLKSLRKQRGLTQEQLGRQLGLSQRSIAQFEADPDKASFERVLRVCSALGVDVFLKERSGSPQESEKSPAW